MNLITNKSIFADRQNHQNNLLECDIRYELNHFERSLICNHNKRRLVPGQRRAEFDIRIGVINHNFDDIIGRRAEGCLYDLRHVIPMLNFQVEIDTSPLWKQRRKRQECDVTSVLDLKQKRVNVKTRLKMEANNKFMAQVYLDRSWSDLFYMRNIVNDKRFMLDHCTGSQTALKTTADECFDKVKQRMVSHNH